MLTSEVVWKLSIDFDTTVIKELRLGETERKKSKKEVNQNPLTYQQHHIKNMGKEIH